MSTTAAGFLDMVAKSGLVTAQQLEEVFGTELPSDPDELANTLIRAELLTQFQAKQLLVGKYRGFFLGPYKILRPVGKGGMGVVFLGEHTSLDRKVALKILAADKAKDKLTLDRFQREARAAAALDHPNIVRLHDISQAAGVHFLVMEFVDGNDLQTLMAQTGPLHYAQAAQYIAQAAAGLHHAHEKGFVHRDMKPSNLILSKDGLVKILDMGLARSFNNDRDNLTALQADGEIAGTIDFLSPEQAMNQPLDGRCDIYSLGATFYALVTGQPPFAGTTAQKLAQHQMREPPDASRRLNGRVPPALSAVIARMMAKPKAERYQTTADVIDALSPWLPAPVTGSVVIDPVTRSDLGGVTKYTTNSARPRPAGDPQRKRLYYVAGCAAVGVVVAVGALAAHWSGGPTPPIARTTPQPPTEGRGASPAAEPTPAVDSRFRLVGLGEVATASAGGPLFLGMERDKFAFEQWGVRTVNGIPFNLPNPTDLGRNIIALHSPMTPLCNALPRTVTVATRGPAQTLHFLSGVSGWGWQPQQPNDFPPVGTPTLTVRLRYADGSTEDHVWKNGEHFADFYTHPTRTDVPGSTFAFTVKTAQVRYLTITPAAPGKDLAAIEFIKAEDDRTTCPVILAVTAEQPVGPRPSDPVPDAARGRFQPVAFGAAASAPAGGPLFARFPNDKLQFEPWGEQVVRDVPFLLPDPADGRNNILTFFGPQSEPTRQLPRSARVLVGGPVRAVHFLGGVSAWGWPYTDPAGKRPDTGTTALTVRLAYADGSTEDHVWKNGEHFADYAKRFDVPGSEFAFLTKNGKQVRYLALTPRRPDQVVTAVEFIKGEDDHTSPAVIAMTVERPGGPPPAGQPAPAGQPTPPDQPPPVLQPAPPHARRLIRLDLATAATTVVGDPPGGQWGPYTVAGVVFDLAEPKDGRPNGLRPGVDPPGRRVSCFLAAKAVHVLLVQPGEAAAEPLRVRLLRAGQPPEVVELKETGMAASAPGVRCLTATPTQTGAISHIELEAASSAAAQVLGITVETP